jgi:hypothetical protein
MSSKNRITSQQLVELIIGRELTTSEIMALLREKYPHHTTSRSVISQRLQSMLGSPFVEIEQSGRKNLTKWHLKKSPIAISARAKKTFACTTVSNPRRINHRGISNRRSSEHASCTRCLTMRWPVYGGTSDG